MNIKKISRHSKNLASLAASDINRLLFSQYFPRKPVVINMSATDICNSECRMCNIWKNSLKKEVTAEELKSILKDPLFSEVRHVGITGGEPTLRKDLSSLYEAVCTTLPKIEGASIISNAIRENEVLPQIKSARDVCVKNNVSFSCMISLDGYQDVHDGNRGRPGNFESALHVIQELKKEKNIPVAIGCTITKFNVWGVDDLLDFMIQEDIYGRFRVAEYINRLYNSDLTPIIRNFDEEEVYHLTCFFKKLISQYEKNNTYQRTYRSIIDVLNNKKRRIACPYQSQGVVLDAFGNLQYCAPRSPQIGNALKTSGMELYRKNIRKRRKVLKNNCNSCIHDYHAPLTAREMFENLIETRVSGIIQSNHDQKLIQYSNIQIHRIKKYDILIIGWYGTETVGDKAILGSIYNDYKKSNPGCSIGVASLDTDITLNTIRELNLDADVIDLRHATIYKYVKKCDNLVIGGGPLMEIPQLYILRNLFRYAKKNRVKTTIYGCGIGPIYKEKFWVVVKEILEYSDSISLRDSESVDTANHLLKNCKDKSVSKTKDPAVSYLQLVREDSHDENRKELGLFLRDWGVDYKGQRSIDEFNVEKEKFEKNLAEVIKNIFHNFDLTPVFYPMHTFHVGGDDRDFARRFIKTYLSDIKTVISHKPSTVESTIKGMKQSKLNICMRFHSVLFANTLEVPYVAIDYTNKGKIHNLLKEENKMDRMFELKNISKEGTAIEQYISSQLEAM